MYYYLYFLFVFIVQLSLTTREISENTSEITFSKWVPVSNQPCINTIVGYGFLFTDWLEKCNKNRIKLNAPSVSEILDTESRN